VARSSGYFGSDLVIDPTVSHRAAEAVRRAYERDALVEYRKAWARDERAFDVHTRIQACLGFTLLLMMWCYTFGGLAFFLPRGYPAGQVLGTFLVPGLISFGLFTLMSLPESWKAAIRTFSSMIVWPLTFAVLVFRLQRRRPDRYAAERYHRRYVVPAVDFDEAAAALWARAVETGTVLAGAAGRDADKAAARRMWAIAKLLARSSLPSELDRRSALLDDAARQVGVLGQ
jgi:hypothetical protein